MAAIFKSKYRKLRGTSHAEVMRTARKEYHLVQKRTPKRQPYVRSRYFGSDKVFLNQFWTHLEQKNPADQLRRLKLYLCALDLIRNTTISSDSILDNQDLNTIGHRFWGLAKDGEVFCVQIKQNKRTNHKDFISVFPAKNYRK